MKKHTIVLTVLIVIFLSAIAGFSALVSHARGDCAALNYKEEKYQNAEALQFFASDYRTARDKFLAAGHASGALLGKIRHPNPGPDGQELFTDIALLGNSEADRFLIIISGTHGVEGFAGSAIQVGLLQSGIVQRLPSETAILLIHALNPYGMAYTRRVNEDNVDVNRNFRDHTLPPPPNHSYDRLARYIAPESMSLPSEVVSLGRLLWFRLTAGKQQIKVAISGGQFTHPMGLFYGGRSETWSNHTLRQIIRRYVPATDKVVAIDVHTALGQFGTPQLLPNADSGSPGYRLARAIWDASLFIDATPASSTNTHLSATVKSVIESLLPGSSVASVTLEFGTFPSLDLLFALRAENWLHHHGDESYHRAKAIKSCLLRTYYPDSELWKSAVWGRGYEVVEQALIHLTE